MALLLLGDARPGVDVLVAAQKLLIITSLPFSFFMVFMAFVFLRDILKKKTANPDRRE
jgi:glycine betaine transporter